MIRRYKGTKVHGYTDKGDNIHRHKQDKAQLHIGFTDTNKNVAMTQRRKYLIQ